MTQRDIENLKFLRELSSKALEEWFNQADEEDREYAAELLDAWEKELDQMLMASARTVEANVRPTGVTLH